MRTGVTDALMMKRIHCQTIRTHDRMQEAPYCQRHAMRGIFARHILTVLNQGYVGHALLQILINTAIQCCRQHLNAPTDTEHGNLAVKGQADEKKFCPVASGIHTMQRRRRLFTNKKRIQVGTAREQEAIDMRKHIHQCVTFLKRRNYQRCGTSLQH